VGAVFNRDKKALASPHMIAAKNRSNKKNLNNKISNNVLLIKATAL